MPSLLIDMFSPRPQVKLTPFEENNEVHAKREVLDRQPPSNEAVGRPESLEYPPVGAKSAGALKPDWIVLQMVKKDSKAGPRYFQGFRKFKKPDGSFDRSKDDFALASALAFYCNHNWDQYVKLFCRSALYGEKPGVLYLALTLSRAFLKQTKNSDDAKNKGGRPLSETTKAVLDLRSNEPHLRPIEMARRLHVNPLNVNNILSRNKKAA